MGSEAAPKSFPVITTSLKPSVTAAKLAKLKVTIFTSAATEFRSKKISIERADLRLAGSVVILLQSFDWQNHGGRARG
jgi:hypothetical protein